LIASVDQAGGEQCSPRSNGRWLRTPRATPTHCRIQLEPVYVGVLFDEIEAARHCVLFDGIEAARRCPRAVIVMTRGEDRASDDPLPDDLTLRELALAVQEPQRRSQADFVASIPRVSCAPPTTPRAKRTMLQSIDSAVTWLFSSSSAVSGETLPDPPAPAVTESRARCRMTPSGSSIRACRASPCRR